MATTGTAILDFGTGSASASAAVTGQAAIQATSLCDAFMQGNTTADHNEDEHLVETIRLVCGLPAAGSGFTIHAEITAGQARGQFKCHWVWA